MEQSLRILHRIFTGVCSLLLWLTPLLVASYVGATRDPEIPQVPRPQVVVKLGKLGWKPTSPAESDSSLFRHFSLGRLEAMDEWDRVFFLSDDVVVAYHPVQENQENKDYRAVRREIEAFFIRASDGSLLLTKRWPSVARKDLLDSRDTEGRIIPVSRDRFLVHAGGVLMLYSNSMELIGQRKLEPAGLNDLWAARSIPGGRYVLLRHGAPSTLFARYEWLTSDTLETKSQIDTDSLLNPVGTEDSLVGGSPPGFSTPGIREIALGKHENPICDTPACSHAQDFAWLSQHSLAFVTRSCLGVADTHQGMLWSDCVEPRSAPVFGKLRSTEAGGRFAVSLYTGSDFLFHGEEVRGSLTIFIYGSKNQTPLYHLPAEAISDFGLSPDGAKLASLSENTVRIYSVN